MSTCTGCPEKQELLDDEFAVQAKRFDLASCFTSEDNGLNLFAALLRIEAAIIAFTEAQQEHGFASGVLQFSIPGGALTDDDVVDIQMSRVPFNYKITGFGISVLTFPTSAGVYTTDDTIDVQLWNYTDNVQIGNTLRISFIKLSASHINVGNAIGNITKNKIIGCKYTYNNNDGGAFTSPVIHTYIHIEPTELVVIT